MSEYLFGVVNLRIPARDHARINAIAEQHGCAFTNPNLPGDGWRAWFAGPNRGEPFDRQMAAAVFADLDAAGLTAKYWPARLAARTMGAKGGQARAAHLTPAQRSAAAKAAAVARWAHRDPPLD